MDLLKRIAELMKEKGWSQKKLAEKADLPQSTINGIFTRGRSPSIPTLEAISKAFDIPLRDLLCDGLTPTTLTQEQLELFDKWSACTPEQKKLLMQLIDQFK